MAEPSLDPYIAVVISSNLNPLVLRKQSYRLVLGLPDMFSDSLSIDDEYGLYLKYFIIF